MRWFMSGWRTLSHKFLPLMKEKWQAFRHKYIPETREEWRECIPAFFMGAIPVIAAGIVVVTLVYISVHPMQRPTAPAAPLQAAPTTQVVVVTSEVPVTVSPRPGKQVERTHGSTPASPTALPAQVVVETQLPASGTSVKLPVTTTSPTSPIPSETVKPTVPPSDPVVSDSVNTPTSP